MPPDQNGILDAIKALSVQMGNMSIRNDLRIAISIKNEMVFKVAKHLYKPGFKQRYNISTYVKY